MKKLLISLSLFIVKGTQKTFTFTKKGMTSYQCNFHPSMTGSVTVE